MASNFSRGQDKTVKNVVSYLRVCTRVIAGRLVTQRREAQAFGHAVEAWDYLGVSSLRHEPRADVLMIVLDRY